MTPYDHQMICQAAQFHEQELEAQSEREDMIGSRFARLAERYSRMALRPQAWDYTEELLETIESLTNDLEG